MRAGSPFLVPSPPSYFLCSPLHTLVLVYYFSPLKPCLILHPAFSMGCQSFSALFKSVTAPMRRGVCVGGGSGSQGRGRAEPLTGSSPKVALIKDNQTFHGAKINLQLFPVLHLIMPRLSDTFSAVSHCTEAPLLLPQPGSWRGPEKDAAL